MAKPCTPHLHCAARAALQAKGRQCKPFSGGSKGGILFGKRITPFKSPKRKVLTLQASSSKSCDACRLHFPARGIAAFSVAIRFASAPTIRCCAAVGGSDALRMRHTPCGCRSAYLVGVRTNFRLPPVSTMRRAQQCRIRQAVCRRSDVTRASR